MRNAYKINLLNTMRIIIIDVTWKGVGKPNIWPTFIKHQWKPKQNKLEMNFTNGNGLEETTLISLEVLVKKTYHLINDRNACIDWHYFTSYYIN